MKAINTLFESEHNGLLNIYFTAGYPKLDSLPTVVKSLEDAGADMLEIGIPYSDPLSDGPTIQNSSAIAIKNGITTDLIFEQLASCQTDIPIFIMAYFNSIYQYGIESFCKKCKETGVAALIIPDLPLEIYIDQYAELFRQYELGMVFLVTPETASERIKLIDEYSEPFIYAVSSLSTTGKNKELKNSEDYFQRLKEMELKTPWMVGFNIKNREDFNFVSNYCSGGIIGSAYIKSIGGSRDLAEDTTSFIHSIRP